MEIGKAYRLSTFVCRKDLHNTMHHPIIIFDALIAVLQTVFGF